MEDVFWALAYAYFTAHLWLAPVGALIYFVFGPPVEA